MLKPFLFSRMRDRLSVSSGEVCRADLPLFNSNSTRLFLLLSFSCTTVREVALPEDDAFHSLPTKKRKNVLVFIACVRLHKLGLLSDRLKSRRHDSSLHNILDTIPGSLREDLYLPCCSASQATMTNLDLLVRTCPNFLWLFTLN